MGQTDRHTDMGEKRVMRPGHMKYYNTSRVTNRRPVIMFRISATFFIRVVLHYGLSYMPRRCLINHIMSNYRFLLTTTSWIYGFGFCVHQHAPRYFYSCV